LKSTFRSDSNRAEDQPLHLARDAQQRQSIFGLDSFTLSAGSTVTGIGFVQKPIPTSTITYSIQADTGNDPNNHANAILSTGVASPTDNGTNSVRGIEESFTISPLAPTVGNYWDTPEGESVNREARFARETSCRPG
jgi:hypothetical protein